MIARAIQNQIIMISQTEENYLKAIFKISERNDSPANTNAIAAEINTSAASVSDMISRLAKKEVVHYEKWKGVTLTQTGRKIATNLIRKHRLWEVFLTEKLYFSWDEVHPIAEQLEHIRSEKLVNKLDTYLGHPKFDPHGDPIPDENGNFTYRKQILLSEFEGEQAIVVGVDEHSTQFLQFLDRLGIGLGIALYILEKYDYDDSLRVSINNSREHILSQKVTQNLFVKRIEG